jgi:2-hydroxy-3-oxopropionate reductase
MSTSTSSSTRAALGFIGLGIMGAPMCGHLLAAGHTVHAHSRSGVPAALQAAGAKVCASPREVALAADIVFLMLPDTPDVQAVLFADNGVAAGLAAGKTVADCSSISPTATREFAQQIQALQCHYLDAPVSGGEVGAKAASLSIMVGGGEADFQRVRPLFELMGKNITHVGDVGAGQITKVANQMIVALNIAAVAEALTFAREAGADPARVRQAILGGFAGSRVLDVHGERMIKRTFEPGFRLRLHRKDLGLALGGAAALGLQLPQTALAAELMQRCEALGLLESDHSALLCAVEQAAGALRT